MTAPADTRLAELQRSRWLADRTAARLAADLDGKDAWEPVDSDRTLADRYEVSPGTVRNAKHHLRELGIITKTGNAWYVRPPAARPVS